MEKGVLQITKVTLGLSGLSDGGLKAVEKNELMSCNVGEWSKEEKGSQRS
jgi:hypothetical protein